MISLEELSKLNLLHEIDQDGILKVQLDEGHSVGWNLEGTCDDCFLLMRAISAIPELVSLALHIEKSCDEKTAKQKARRAIAKIASRK